MVQYLKKFEKFFDQKKWFEHKMVVTCVVPKKALGGLFLNEEVSMEGSCLFEGLTSLSFL